VGASPRVLPRVVLREAGGHSMANKKPDPIDIEVGRRIRIQRMARGISQTELGDKIGVTFQQVQKYEKGANRVGAGRLTRIAKVLGVSVGTFFGGPDEGAAAPGDRLDLEYLVIPGALRLLRAYGQIREPVLRRTIVTFVERIVAGEPPTPAEPK
jgi:transcriptional regulator with XRE-family HTH domain